ncbi:hypothetical protein B0H13DRAFT_1894767 [Mycena leptocephala]|nr:hypothetical protein B0H13DRAFT_1894767 [Mycena leptocephala]
MTEYHYSPNPSLTWRGIVRLPWLPVDPTGRTAVRGMEPATGPPDSELSAMANIPRDAWSYSLLDLLEKIYDHYDAGYSDAFFRVSGGLAENQASRLKQILQRYDGGINLPFFKGSFVSSTAREGMCTAGMAGIRRIWKACRRLGANINVDKLARCDWPNHDSALAHEITNLKARCQQLEYLFRTGRACPRNRARVEELLANIKMSYVLEEIEFRRGPENFSDLYVKFCELALVGGDAAATIRDLRKLVKDEVDQANRRVEEFNALRKHYEDGGRQDLVILMQENAKAGRKAGFEEGMASAEESQQIYDELGKIDRGLAKIGEILKESKEFWEGELRIERHAEKIHAGLQTVHSAAQHCSKSKKIRKAGDKIVGDAATLTKNCTDVVQTQKSAEIHLHNPVCDQKSGRKALSPLKKGLRQLVTGYEKLSLRFKKYAEMIYLLVWFAGSSATDKLLTDKPEYVQVAQAELISKGLFTSSYSSYALPFEIVFTSLDRQLHDMRKLWSELVMRVDGLDSESANPTEYGDDPYIAASLEGDKTHETQP